MSTHLEIGWVRESDPKLVQAGKIPVLTISSIGAPIPTEIGQHETELGLVSVQKITTDIDGIDQQITVNGPMVGKEINLELDMSGRGRMRLEGGKVVGVYVEEADQEANLHLRLVLRRELLSTPFPSMDNLKRRLLASDNLNRKARSEYLSELKAVG